MIARVFIPTAELAIPTGTPINEANAEIEKEPLTEELNLRNLMQTFNVGHLMQEFNADIKKMSPVAH